MEVRQFLALILSVLMISVPVQAAVRGERAQYLGGTADIPKDARGAFEFGPKNAAYVHDGGRFELPYAAVTSIEYGAKVGHRIGAAIALGVTVLGLLALPIAYAKKKKHYVTIGYTRPDGTAGGLVFECPKSNYWITLEEFRVRTGIRPQEVSDHDKLLAGTAVPPAPAAKPPVQPAALPAAAPAEEPRVPKPSAAPARSPEPKPERDDSNTVVKLPG